MCRVCEVYMRTPPEPDAYARRLQRVCSSRVTLKYVTLTLTLTLMFAHPPRPRIELRACGYAHVPSVWSVHANPARAGRVCTPFAARLQLTRNPKIRNPNPNPIMFAHPPRPRIELHTCAYAHVPSMWSVHANPARAGRVCTPFAARLQLTRNPKIRNPTVTLTLTLMFAHPPQP